MGNPLWVAMHRRTVGLYSPAAIVLNTEVNIIIILMAQLGQLALKQPL